MDHFVSLRVLWIILFIIIRQMAARHSYAKQYNRPTHYAQLYKN